MRKIGSNFKKMPTADLVGYNKKDSSFLLSNIFPSSQVAMDLLQQAQVCYDSMYKFRKLRKRNRKYYRGDQWGDTITVNGVTMTEGEYIERQGKPALKQNLIRPQIKNMIGQYRSSPYRSVIVARNREDQAASEMMNVALESVLSMNDTKERDARMLEEFAISSSAIYYTSYSYDNDRQMPIPKFRSVPADNFFQTPNSNDVCGEDVDFIGHFIDLSLDDVISQYANGDYKKAERIKEIYSHINGKIYNTSGNYMFSAKENITDSITENGNYDSCRVIKICRLEARWMLYVHDYADASYEIRELSDLPMIEAENAARLNLSLENGVEYPLIDVEKKYIRLWKYYHITPYGNILFEAENPYLHKNHPYITKFYPLIDGEVWSMVDDMIDQQRMINRMIILYDFIVSASAKGVLLVPEDCIPDDMDIEDFADEWTRYNGVIKIKTKPGSDIPKQISTNNVNIGMVDMINMQIKFLQDIGGIHGAIQGKEAVSGTPSSLYQQQAMNAQLNILDYLETYNHFIQKRDMRIVQLIKQYFKEPMYISLAGRDYSEEARHFDPNKIRNVDFDSSISNIGNSATFRSISDKMLENLLMNNFISIEMYLEHCSFPFADKMLEAIRIQKQKVQNGVMPTQQDMQNIAQQAPQGTQEGSQFINKFLNRAEA